MKQKIGYYLLSVWIILLIILLLIVLSTSYSSEIVIFVTILSVSSIVLLPVSAFLINSKILKTVSLIPFFLTIIYIFILRPYKIVGNSMYPNIKDGEYVLNNLSAYKFNTPHTGDIVIFGGEPKNIARVYAEPNDVLEVRNKTIYVNNKVIENHNTLSTETIRYTLGKSEYLLIGDNVSRTDSWLNYGKIDLSSIQGRVTHKYWPRFEKIKFEKEISNTQNQTKDNLQNTKNGAPSQYCYRYNTPTVIKNNNYGVVECSIISSERIDINKSYCEANISKKKAYFKGFLQGNDYGYNAVLDDVDAKDTATLKIFDLGGNLINCINKLQE